MRRHRFHARAGRRARRLALLEGNYRRAQVVRALRFPARAGRRLRARPGDRARRRPRAASLSPEVRARAPAPALARVAEPTFARATRLRERSHPPPPPPLDPPRPASLLAHPHISVGGDHPIPLASPTYEGAHTHVPPINEPRARGPHPRASSIPAETYMHIGTVRETIARVAVPSRARKLFAPPRARVPDKSPAGKPVPPGALTGARAAPESRTARREPARAHAGPPPAVLRSRPAAAATSALVRMRPSATEHTARRARGEAVPKPSPRRGPARRA